MMLYGSHWGDKYDHPQTTECHSTWDYVFHTDSNDCGIREAAYTLAPDIYTLRSKDANLVEDLLFEYW